MDSRHTSEKNRCGNDCAEVQPYVSLYAAAKGAGAHGSHPSVFAHSLDVFACKKHLMHVHICPPQIDLRISPSVPEASAFVATGLGFALHAVAIACRDVVLIQQIKVGNSCDGVELAHPSPLAADEFDDAGFVAFHPQTPSSASGIPSRAVRVLGRTIPFAIKENLNQPKRLHGSFLFIALIAAAAWLVRIEKHALQFRERHESGIRNLLAHELRYP